MGNFLSGFIGRRAWRLPGVVVLALTFAGLGQSQGKEPGITDSQILIGSCSALDGPARFLGLQTVLGATTYLNLVNDQGGVHGRKIQLLAFNDGYEPEQARMCYRRMIREGVFALGFFVGTPTAAVYVPMAEADKIPVVGLFTGAQLLYEPLKHYIINVRASYYDETREQVENLWSVLGVRKIGVIYQDDAFGKAVLEGVKIALKRHNSAPVALGTFTRNTLDVAGAISTVRSANPEAVVLVGPYAPVAEIVKQGRAKGWNPMYSTVSFVGTEAFIKEAGSAAEGVVVTQVVPPYDRTDLATIKMYREALNKYSPGTEPNFVSLEGFVDAMVLVEGLKRAGRDLTRDRLIQAIESIKNKDIGLGSKLHLDYGPKDHKGFDGVYDTVIRGGKPVVFADWRELRKPSMESSVR